MTCYERLRKNIDAGNYLKRIEETFKEKPEEPSERVKSYCRHLENGTLDEWYDKQDKKKKNKEERK